MTARIRDATEADLPAIVALMQQLGYPDEAREPGEAHRRALAQLQATPGQRLLVLEDEAGRVVATAQLMILPNLSLHALPRAIIENVCVDARERGRGYGAQLVRYCVAQARAAGCFKLALTTNLRRRDAHRFWEAQGFVHTHRGYSLALNALSSEPQIDTPPAEE